MRLSALAFSTVGLLLVLNQPARASVCGDGWIDPPEECDDGNLVNGDGCASTSASSSSASR